MKRDYHFFDRWARANKMKPVCRVEEKDGDVLIADSGSVITEDGRTFYRTGFAIERDQAWLASTHEYEWTEFPEETLRGKQQRRINEALDFARKYIAQTVEAGLYDAQRSFSRPVH